MTMRAYELQGAFGLDNLKLVDRPTPEPGPGEVRVRVEAVSLNYRDLLMCRGHYNPRQPLPLVPCSDGAGVIDAVGPGVDASRIGERVAGCFAPRWLDGEPTRETMRATLGGPLDGTLREQMVLPEAGVVTAPEHLSAVEASTLPCAALTAWSALATLATIRAGDTVLVLGTGGVSMFALDLAVALGARVIATSSSPAKLKRLQERGASDVINYREDATWGKTARKLTGGRGVDLVVEVGGAGTLEQSMKAVRPGGTIALIGVLAGDAAPINLLPILMSQVRVQGVLVGHRAGFEAMNRAISQHQLKPVVDRVFAFEDARAAFDHLASGGHVGKVCIDLS